MGPTEETIRVAVTQAEPVWLDLDACIAKACKLIKEAAANDAKLVTFPELWFPGYPAWIWDVQMKRPVDFVLGTTYQKSSLKLNSPQMQKLCASAAENNIAVHFGFSENADNSLYISQGIIGPDGLLKMVRRKLKPTHMERTVFGDANGNTLKNVVDVEGVGRGLGRLFIPLWKGLDCGEGIDKMGTEGSMFGVPGGGSSAIYGPDGRQLTNDIGETEEGILYADLDFDEVLRSKSFVDVAGHYSRPDMLWLGVDDREKLHLRAQRDEDNEKA
ncbi:uncharacterized protein L3040_007938 [Drepanopeziza brunnea f. sp. 'multigermtubi']|uniref:uncharacterized protein n=1 Tax=Drepanopeziza brunnea f. sp. 'multigermtubi' TaxID=698441 RepID=UPI002397AE05|nr:hypothetical protein L3040_007938 [Drepanopeziza brunnea f. sp. 'multigermtubi']